MKKEDLGEALKSLKLGVAIINELYKEVQDAKASDNLEDWQLANNLQGTLWHIRNVERDIGQAIELLRRREGET